MQIEVDDGMKVHVHFYVFCSREKNDFKILTHHKESWELEFKDVDQENETLVAEKRPDLHVHECLQNVLVIENFYFCFFQKVCVLEYFKGFNCNFFF